MATTDRRARNKALKAYAKGQMMYAKCRYVRARRLLQSARKIARRTDEHDVRQSAEALLAKMPRKRTVRWWAVLSVAAGVPTLATTAIVAAIWANLPDAEETRQIARSAHIHVAKRTVATDAGKRDAKIKRKRCGLPTFLSLT